MSGSSLFEAHYAAEIESKRAAIDTGDGDALLSAIESVALSNMAMPDWLARKVVQAIRKYTHHKASTLDAAFNIRRPGGYKRPAQQDRWDRAGLVVSEVIAMRRSGEAVDDLMFEQVGSKHGIKKTKAKDWYYFHKNNKTVTYVALMRAAGLPLDEKE